MSDIENNGEITPLFSVRAIDNSASIPTFLDPANTAATWAEVMQYWGVPLPKNPNPDNRTIIALPRGWKTNYLSFSGDTVIIDKNKRVRAKYKQFDYNAPLHIVPAVSYAVDYDTHLDGDYNAKPHGIKGIVKVAGKVVHRTALIAFTVRRDRDGNETENSIKSRQQTVATLQDMVKSYISLRYPNSGDAMYYWD